MELRQILVELDTFTESPQTSYKPFHFIYITNPPKEARKRSQVSAVPSVKLYQGVADVVGGALDAVGSLPRTIPPLPNPFLGGNNDLGDSSIERVMEADNKTLTAEIREQAPQFCRKESVNQSLEDVLSNIEALSEFLGIYQNSNLSQQR